MGVMRVQASLERHGGLPEDVVVNTWHFQTTGAPDDPAAADAFAALEDFYLGIDGYLSSVLTGGLSFKAYDLAEATPRTPFSEADAVATLTLGTGDPLPSEIAVALSYRSFYESGTPNARRRGRVYIGPLDSSAVVEGVNLSDVHVANGCTLAIANAAEALRDAMITAASPWCVYSRKTDETETLDASAFPVQQGWIDNAFDVQRRRGAAATTRELWS